VRAVATERLLAGSPWNADTAERAASALANEFTPIDDMRASAAYRRRALGNLMRRLWLETGERSIAPTRVEDVGRRATLA
jgi:xanthine dehydrogenase small subunit